MAANIINLFILFWNIKFIERKNTKKHRYIKMRETFVNIKKMNNNIYSLQKT